MSKAIVTVDNSPETLAKFDRRVAYANATPTERRAMANAEQKAWDEKYLKDILMPGEKATLRFTIKRCYLIAKDKLLSLIKG